MELTANTVLLIAMELEKMGKTLYESLSQGCGNDEIAALASALASAEEEHLAVFENMRNALPLSLRRDVVDSRELFAQVASLHKDLLPSPKDILRIVRDSDFAKTVDMAIEVEARAIAFYADLSGDIQGLDQAVLKEIAEEERAHLRMLREARFLMTHTDS